MLETARTPHRAPTDAPATRHGSLRGRPVRTYLMCPPTYFTVDYSINPWMDPRVPVDTARAVRQWERLRQTYRLLGHTIHLIDPVPGLPDMVFAANGGTVIGGRGSWCQVPARGARRRGRCLPDAGSARTATVACANRWSPTRVRAT